MRLLKLKLDRFDAGLGIEHICLEAARTKRIEFTPVNLHHKDEDQDTDLSNLFDALLNRLGEEKIFRFKTKESHVPERSFEKAPIDSCFDEGREKSVTRPIRLIHPPEPIDVIAMLPDSPPRRITWKNRFVMNVVKADGPERIENEWWLNNSGETRDYYRVESANGFRLWVYREGSIPQWFVHGVFA